jgi:hypothetical protein
MTRSIFRTEAPKLHLSERAPRAAQVSSVRPHAHIRLVAPVLLLAGSAFLFGCTGWGDDLERRTQVSYYDRNGDGKVDLEKHKHPEIADTDWELRDDDYDGRYEKKILYGFAVKESAVDIRVPARVKIERTR